MSRPRFSIATVSLGKYASLGDKLNAASKAGYDGIELFDEDWTAFTQNYKDDFEAAKDLNSLAKSMNLRIECFQPFRAYEGCPDRNKHKNDLNRARHLFKIMNILKTDLLLVCSNVSNDAVETLIVDDMIELCLLASKYGIKVGYEALAWGTHIDTWKQAWNVVQSVNLPNCGIILDSFNQLGREYADPTTVSGKIEDGCDIESKTRKNIQDVARIPGHRIFLYQVADAAKMTPPLNPADVPDQPVRMTWSRGNRLFPEETYLGAYLPVAEFTKAVLSTGYTGPLSLEVFNKSLQVDDVNVPTEHARRGYQGLERLFARCIQPHDSSPFVQAKF